MRRLKVKVPITQSPFFVGADGQLYLDVLWDFGDELEFTAEDLADLIQTASPGSVVVGRKLTGAEVKQLLELRGSGEHEAFASFVATEDRRWGRRRSASSRKRSSRRA